MSGIQKSFTIFGSILRFELHVHHMVGRLKGALNQELSSNHCNNLTRLATSIHICAGDNSVSHMLVQLYPDTDDYTRAMVKYSSDYVEETVCNLIQNLPS